MKSFHAARKDILEKVRNASDIVLLLDYDGTLAPIVTSPKRARMSPFLRKHLQQCAKLFPTAIISGRVLDDLQNRIGMGIACAGNHGLEWFIGRRRYTAPRSRMSTKTLQRARSACMKLYQAYNSHGVFVEDKNLTLALHYRSLPSRLHPRFVKEADIALNPHIRELRIENNMFTYEIRPRDDWHKGASGRIIFKLFARNRVGVLPIYIGDGATDEDAFREFRDGITIRVGKDRTSAAKYYFEERKEVDAFIRTLMNIRQSMKVARPISPAFRRTT